MGGDHDLRRTRPRVGAANARRLGRMVLKAEREIARSFFFP